MLSPRAQFQACRAVLEGGDEESNCSEENTLRRLQKEAACWRSPEIRLVHFGRCTWTRVESAGMHRVDRAQ